MVSHQDLHCLRRSPEDLACSLHSAGHLSPAHTQVSVLKVLVRAELKISPESRENPDPDQAFKALPSGLGGKGGGLREKELDSRSCRGDRVFFK